MSVSALELRQERPKERNRALLVLSMERRMVPSREHTKEDSSSAPSMEHMEEEDLMEPSMVLHCMEAD